MTASKPNALDQALDIAGSSQPASNLNLSEEALGLGSAVAGQAGASASITTFSGSGIVITGLTGMTVDSVGNFLQLQGAASSGNNGTFQIDAYVSATSVSIVNVSAVQNDANNGNLLWAERNPYSLQDDLNYERTDRAAIKGVDYSDTVPTYQRPTAIGVSIPANLANIAGKTTDAVSYNVNRIYYGQSVQDGYGLITLVSSGNLKHSDLVDETGIPCFDSGPFVNDYNSCFVSISDSSDNEIKVLTGFHAGEQVFGLTFAGSATSPNSIEVHFYSYPTGSPVNSNTATPYSWESGQATTINAGYGYNERLDQLDQNALRTNLATGATIGNFLTDTAHQTLRQLIHFLDEGPGDGFDSGAYKETIGQPFPTLVTWYTDITKSKKIVEKTITRTGPIPTTITWEVYMVDGITVAHTVTDMISYTNNVFESSRTRTIT